MSKYEHQIDDCNAICPYCKAEYQVESETYDACQRTEQCDACGMFYHIHQEFTVDHNTAPDCKINKQEHDYEWKETNSGGAYFCNTCGKCRLRKEV